jgi:hypothetical protein
VIAPTNDKEVEALLTDDAYTEFLKTAH